MRCTLERIRFATFVEAAFVLTVNPVIIKNNSFDQQSTCHANFAKIRLKPSLAMKISLQ